MKSTPASDVPVLPPSKAQARAPAHRTLGREDALAVLLLVGCIVTVFWRVVFTSAMFFHRDVFSYTYPHAWFIHNACRHGQLPFWNYSLNFGEPVLSNPNFLFFYPYTLLIVALPIDFAYTAHYILHFVLAGVGTYALARRWSQSRGAAVSAALVFALSGPLLSLGSFYNHTACAAWIPWALLVTDYAIESSSLRPWILLTLVLAVQWLAGEPFTWLATFVLIVAYALYRRGDAERLMARANWRILAKFVLVGGATIALAAVQFLPASSLLRESRRGLEGLPYGETTSWSFHPLLLLETVLPDFFGDAMNSPSLWTSVLSCRNRPYLPVIFIGFIPLFFALAGWALGRDRRRTFAAVSGLSLLLLSFGRFLPFFSLAYLLFPPLELVRFPVKLLVPAVLLTSLLAGWGVDALRELKSPVSQSKRRLLLPLQFLLASVLLVWIICWIAPGWVSAPAARILVSTNQMFLSTPAGNLSPGEVKEATQYLITMLRLYFPGLAGFALGGLLWISALEHRKTWARRALPAIALLGLGQLMHVSSSANPTVPKTFYSFRPPVLDHFDRSGEPYRFCYIFRESLPATPALQAQGFLNFDSIPEARDLSQTAQIAFRDRLLLARATMLTGAEGTFNIDVEGSYPHYIYEFWLFALRRLTDPARVDCLLGRTNVKYQIARTRRENGAAREVAPIFNGSPEPSYLDENPCLAPRAYAAGRVLFSGDSNETLEHMSAPDFDERNEVILNAKPGPASPRESSESAGRVAIVDRQQNTVTLSADFTRPGYVVLLDRFDPNWHATVDGHEVPIVRANLLFRAVRAEAGKHEVRFYYRQEGLKEGLLISIAALVVLTVVYVLNPRQLA